MSQILRRPPATASVMFTGAKIARPIPVTSGWLNELLVHASLEPLVTSIEQVPQLIINGLPRFADAVVVEMACSLCVIEVVRRDAVESNTLGAIAAKTLGLPRLSLVQDVLRVEPGATNRRLTWACRRHPVSVADRFRILERLGQEGGELPLGELGEHLGASDPISAILRLVCDGELDADLSDRMIGARTKIRTRRSENGGHA